MKPSIPAPTDPDGMNREPVGDGTSSTRGRREFVELAAKVGAGAVGLGALLSLGRQAGVLAQETAGETKPPTKGDQTVRGPVLHNRRLDQETIKCLQQTGMELIAYTFGVEAVGQQARAILGVGKKTKNGTTCTTCCHPD